MRVHLGAASSPRLFRPRVTPFEPIAARAPCVITHTHAPLHLGRPRQAPAQLARFPPKTPLIIHQILERKIYLKIRAKVGDLKGLAGADAGGGRGRDRLWVVDEGAGDVV